LKAFIMAILVLAGASASAFASFDERVALAKKFEDSDQGQKFQQLLFQHIGDYTAKAMRGCFPAGVKADTQRFVLVANLRADRSLIQVESRPDRPMTRCFQAKFVLAPFPPPPKTADRGGLPIVLEIKIVP
jgi:hypothetical protein